MDNILKYPQSTIVNRVVPKTMFYRFMDVNTRMKARFVNDVVSITWLYKLSAATLNVTDTKLMTEIEVFVVNLKQSDCPADLFTFIDTNMPHHIVFVLVHEGHAMLLVNYKDWAARENKGVSGGREGDTPAKFKIMQTFTSPWMPADSLQLHIDGRSLPRIYDNFVAQISGIGEHKAGCMADIVALKQQIAAAEAELKTMERRMRKEPQLDRQMQMNAQVKAKRRELDSLRNNLNNLK